VTDAAISTARRATDAATDARRATWTRRAKTIPIVLGATAAGAAASPVIAAVATGRDLARRDTRLPTLRMAAFVGQYLLNDSAEILAAGPLWLAAGCGTRLDQPRSRRRHERLQAWSIGVLARRAEKLLGVRLAIEAATDLRAVFHPGPVIVVCRHVSLLDASLPALLAQQAGMHTRGVVMAELLADPGFDLLYQRSGSVFVARDHAPEARVQVAHLAAGLDPGAAAAIFPEGRLFRSDVLTASLARLRERAPDRASRLSHLRHLLPPRPAGFQALLEGAPDADVVVVNHAGLDPYPRIAELARHVPLAAPIAVHVARIARADIPATPEHQTVWLDERWCDMDGWVDDRLGALRP